MSKDTESLLKEYENKNAQLLEQLTEMKHQVDICQEANEDLSLKLKKMYLNHKRATEHISYLEKVLIHYLRKTE